MTRHLTTTGILFLHLIWKGSLMVREIIFLDIVLANSGKTKKLLSNLVTVKKRLNSPRLFDQLTDKKRPFLVSFHRRKLVTNRCN